MSGPRSFSRRSSRMKDWAAFGAEQKHWRMVMSGVCVIDAADANNFFSKVRAQLPIGLLCGNEPKLNFFNRGLSRL